VRPYLIALCLAAPLAFGCAAFGGSRRATKPEQVPALLARAEEEHAAGRTDEALDLVRDAREIKGLAPEQRDAIDLAIERYARELVDELATERPDPGALVDLLDLSLPQQVSVSAGLRAARLYLERGRPYKAYKTLKDLETKYPRHHGRSEAGEILFDAGMRLADDPSHFLGFFSARDDGIEVLEYLTLTYPSERRCDQAFARLAQMYEEDGELEFARERHEDLLFFCGTSPLAVASEARIPHLRLAGLESPEYDRRELTQARTEIEGWLAKHEGHALERDVRVDLADCLRRIAASDLGIARFYRRIDQPFGARFHAGRALETARLARDEGLATAAETLLGALPAVAALPPDAAAPGAGAFSSDESLLRSLERASDRPKVETAPPPEGEKP
jgi:hypothetical protein